MSDNEQLERYINLSKENSMLKYAINEFKYLKWIDKDNKFTEELQGKLCLNVLQILEIVGYQGHSGFSFNYFFSILKRVINYKPITPLENNENEWEKSFFDNSFVHKRCYKVCKELNEETKEYEFYDSDGKYFINPDGSCYSSKESKIKITFPYNVPDKPEYVKVDKDGNILENK